MRTPLPPLAAAAAAAACLLLGACGRNAPADVATPTTGSAAIPKPAGSPRAPLRDWPEFGLDPQRSNVSEAATGITSANVARLRRRAVTLPGTVDSSPIYLHGVLVDVQERCGLDVHVLRRRREERSGGV